MPRDRLRNIRDHHPRVYATREGYTRTKVIRCLEVLEIFIVASWKFCLFLRGIRDDIVLGFQMIGVNYFW